MCRVRWRPPPPSLSKQVSVLALERSTERFNVCFLGSPATLIRENPSSSPGFALNTPSRTRPLRCCYQSRFSFVKIHERVLTRVRLTSLVLPKPPTSSFLLFLPYFAYNDVPILLSHIICFY